MPSRPPREPDGDRLAAFQEEARKIIVLSGGINAMSLGKVRYHAGTLGLSEADIKAVLDRITNPRHDESPRRQAFRQAVERTLKKERLLTDRLGRELERLGRERFRLDATEAAEIIRLGAR